MLKIVNERNVEQSNIWSFLGAISDFFGAKKVTKES